jgi:exopolysaccharide production protein ExoY
VHSGSNNVSESVNLIRQDERYAEPRGETCLPPRLDNGAAARCNGKRGADSTRKVSYPPIPRSSPNGYALLGAPVDQPTGGLSKRMLDIVVVLTSIVILSPVLLLVAAFIFFTMGRPIVFSHRRLGFGGRPFQCLKFRTMVNDAEQVLARHLDNNPDAAREWRATRKLKQDPRTTTLGQILRRSSLDELPQLLSVLMGHMSCVGPRPVVDAEIANYGEYWDDYTRARPGMTGLWQVSGRNLLPYDRRIAMDRHYVRRWSLWRDLAILIRTIPAVLHTDETS